MWWFIFAVLLYGVSLNNVATYDDMGWGMGKRFVHGLWRGAVWLLWLWLVIRGFQSVGVL